MSATGRGAPRRELDFYATPPWVVRAILPHVAFGASVIDAGCGEGAILREVLAHTSALVPPPSVTGIEIDPGRASLAQRHGHVVVGDFLDLELGCASLVIANPPYTMSLDFVRKAIAMTEPSRGTVAMLLRLNFLASGKRAEFHRAHPSDVFVLPRRPSFTCGGTDATEYAWFVWGPGRGGRWSLLDVPRPSAEATP